jgi:glutamate-1-semialdehyde 2,1-aminomutase
MSRYMNSESWLKRAEETVPLGSQTFSKSRTQYPVGISPLYISRAKGANVTDLDGNSYVDLVSALASVTLGYKDRGVDNAIKKQLRKGISYSLPGKLESEVSEKLVEMIPSAEMVRFGKNGSDATSAAIRISRAYTGRDHVAVCGYHGWQDWFIGSTTRDKGVPKEVSGLTHIFKYNDIQSLEALLSTHQIAAVILEPMNVSFPDKDFLVRVKELSNKYGAVLIFDETITGFRFSAGGAQELFGVTPDLSTFGKGIANGMPLSAIVGCREIMMEMENVFFSGTFGGELLSLAAAKHVIDRVQAGEVIGHLESIGRALSNKVEAVIKSNNLNDTLSLSGHNTWRFLNWRESNGYSQSEIKTYFMQEMFSAGVLVLSSHNVSLAHKSTEVKKIANSYETALSNLRKVLDAGNLRENLRVEPLEPLFKVR